MTIHLKDCQTHHIQALPEYLEGTLDIPIPDLLMTSAMATTTATTQIQAQFTHQYLYQDPILNLNLNIRAKYLPKL